MFGIMSGIVFLIAQAATNPYTVTVQRDRSNTQAVMVPVAGIHVRVSSQDQRGQLSCALMSVSGRIYAGSLAQLNNQCDFTYKPKGGMVCNDKGYACSQPMLVILQNDDDYAHVYTVMVSP